MLTDYEGVDLFDAEGDKIGHVERTYVDDNFKTQLVKVKIGTLLVKHRLVPLDDADAASDGLHVSYSKDVIQRSPDISHFDDTLDEDVLNQVRAYYADRQIATSDRTGAGDASTSDDPESSDSEEPRGEVVAARTGTEQDTVQAAE